MLVFNLTSLVNHHITSSAPWDLSNTVCESDSLCDQPVLVSAPNSEPHIRNRRLSPGSGNSGGGGGGGCISKSSQPSPQGDHPHPGHTHALSYRKEKERRGHQHKGRSVRRESPKGVARAGERPWAEHSLSLLKPPPAFPVQDSPAKLQPAVSYASKVKAGAAGGALEEDRPAINVLLQNQWGLSFISEGAGPHPAADGPPPTDATHSADPHSTAPTEDAPLPVTTSCLLTEMAEGNGDLLLSCRHLVEALNYHSRGEWNQREHLAVRGI